MDINIKDKVALVTGGAQGIGLGIVKVFLEAEAKVVIADINEEGLKGVIDELGDRFGERVWGITADISQEEDVKKMVAETVNRFNTIDILVNNAGRGGMHYFWEMSAQEWDDVMNLNLRAILPTTGIAAYCASKGGLLMFTRVAAQELGPHGINVNAIGPGTTITPLTELFYNLPGLKEGFLDRTPKGRFGEPEDIAKVALFLVSEYADWITGQIIYVDGGQSLMGLPKYLEGLIQATSTE